MSGKFWAILIGVSVGLIGLFVITDESEKTTETPVISTDSILEVQANDSVYSDGEKEVSVTEDGTISVADDTSKVTVIEYGDFACPACGAVHPIVDQLKADYGSDLQLIFRHFPIAQAHPNATAAHRAVEAAGNQGKYYEMHDLLFERQQFWTRERSGLSVSAAIDLFKDFAEELNLDMDQFNADSESEAVGSVVSAQADGGTRSGVTGTPTFFINGEQIDTPRDLESFSTLLDAAIEGDSASADDKMNETEAAE